MRVGDTTYTAADMKHFMLQSVEKYCEEAGKTVKDLRKVGTPFVDENIIPDADCERPGTLGEAACSILMKALYGGRLARADVLKAITELGAYVSNWTVACDVKMHRLFCYLYHNLDEYMMMIIGDDTDKLELKLYTDADLAGEKAHTRSTSGNLLAIEGPNSFAPIGFQVKTQKATAEATCESEICSLNLGLRGTGIAALDLWEVILQRKLVLHVQEDNEAAIKVVRKGYSPALRFLHRTQNVRLSWLYEVFQSDFAKLHHCASERMRADPLTKSFSVAKWSLALAQLGFMSLAQMPAALRELIVKCHG